MVILSWKDVLTPKNDHKVWCPNAHESLKFNSSKPFVQEKRKWANFCVPIIFQQCSVENGYIKHSL